MRLFTFPGGIHPKHDKQRSLDHVLMDAFLPDKVVLPLSQHIGAPNEALVKKGDIVEEGQRIAQSAAFVSAPVHSSVSGTVLDVKKAFHPVLGPSLAVIIERDKTKEPKKYEEKPSCGASPDEVTQKIKEAGIAGMGGATFPTHVKLSIPKDKNVDTLIVNGAECEPFLTCDQVLMAQKPAEIIEGARLIAKAAGVNNVVIAVEDNKKEIYGIFSKMLSSCGGDLKMRAVLVRTKYPQGGEKQLIRSVFGKEVPPGKLPMDIGFLVQNVGTVFAVYEAVRYGKPLIERIVTISGDCVDKPGNYKVRVGTTLKELMEKAGINIVGEPKKVVFGGPMMGISQPDLDVPLIKGTSGVLFLSEKYCRDYEEDNCVRCAKCADVCAMRLMPTDIMRNAKRYRFKETEELSVMDCMECGACAYVCPARIPLVQYIKEAKAILRKTSK